MSLPLVNLLIDQHGLAALTDVAAAQSFAAADRPGVMFFPGHTARAAETGDVAVILPELMKAFSNMEGAVIAAECEKEAAAAFGVMVYPCLVFVRSGIVLGMVPKVRDWADYVARIRAFLSPSATGAQA